MARRPSVGAPAAALPAFPREPLRLGSLESTRKIVDNHKKMCNFIRATCGACCAEDGDGVRLRACDSCDAVRYCGRECQREDFLCHRLACKILSTDREIMVGVRTPGSRDASL